ncbi:hypothetical protein HYH03_014474 [Edaphochlamys debaryana]|uniref:HORMA domain-containing protein n=1 Tax=Edaphochlamys debaryana TaxID=47281 RepID=A0A836BS51_9CHLO|nr:hypothetical protein HYH03_014474 [Edaphochlamys debaryana]|eukprot:KAG2486880.1 hypothetical protein HYH03_014474 [Edaphochlamys debaryana]
MVRPQAAAAAQAQAQHQAAISHTESLELVRCLLRVSIFHVSYLRGLFPEKSFKGVDMRNLEDMHVKILMPSCDESRRLVDWVEGGVYDAIKRGFLKNLFFGISTDPEGTQLLEEYIFTFKYGEGRVAMDIAATAGEGGGKKGGKASGEFKQDAAGPRSDLSSVRYQVCRLIRMLVQVCRTLDKVPAERYLFMKLTYQDHTPDEYEPPYFVPVDETGVGHFKRSPFSMAVGKVKSTLDSCDDEAADDAGGMVLGEGGLANDRITAQAQPSAGSVGSGDAATASQTATQAPSTSPAAAALGADANDSAPPQAGAEGPHETDADMDVEAEAEAAVTEPHAEEGAGEQPHQQPDAAAEGAGEAAMHTSDPAAEDDVTEVPESEDYQAVLAYVRGRSQVSLKQLARNFSAMSQPALGAYVDRLAAQGMLAAVPGTRASYRVLAAATQPQTGTQAEALSQPPDDGGAVGRKSNRLQAHKAGDSDAAAALTERMDGLTMEPPPAAGAAGTRASRRAAAAAAANGADTKEAVAEAKAADDAADDRRRSRDQQKQDKVEADKEEAMRSRGGQGGSGEAGDEMTEAAPGNNACGNGKDGAPGGEEGEGAAEVYFDASQASGLERGGRKDRARKTSYVADPIQQGNTKKPKTAGAMANARNGDDPDGQLPDKAPTPRGRGSSRLAAMRR